LLDVGPGQVDNDQILVHCLVGLDSEVGQTLCWLLSPSIAL
jgi:hypothetical protein